ncbi:hypothetical protein [Acidithiobacillus ferridurans]|uniref:hypothetical protein n=1 Tax=Acidithiobacillus ferridurans TaxID=1232575 RepID=UPI001C07D201|nr:hypothetical protein [Acidithiobacillus ferridurans]
MIAEPDAKDPFLNIAYTYPASSAAGCTRPPTSSTNAQIQAGQGEGGIAGNYAHVMAYAITMHICSILLLLGASVWWYSWVRKRGGHGGAEWIRETAMVKTAGVDAVAWDE